MHIMQEYLKKRDIIKAITTTLKLIKAGNYKGLNFIMSDGHSLYIYRDSNPSMPERFEYYSLYWLIRRNEVIACSDSLTDESWQPVEHGQLLIIDKNLKIVKKQLAQVPSSNS